ncbi:MAG TPA: hypothetical protein VNI57_09140 [Candidatus Saccharimonadales bacterium]|nr:hypothetical protein [Candidatus Saccharimonadales bacterium]
MRGWILVLAGTLMLLSAAAHAGLGWPLMSHGLAEAGAPPDLTRGLATGWLWGSVSMACFGVILVLYGLRWRRGDRSGAVPILVVAAGYTVFGAVALALSASPHFLLFIATGLLAGLPVIGGQKSGKVET